MCVVCVVVAEEAHEEAEEEKEEDEGEVTNAKKVGERGDGAARMKKKKGLVGVINIENKRGGVMRNTPLKTKSRKVRDRLEVITSGI